MKNLHVYLLIPVMLACLGAEKGCKDNQHGVAEATAPAGATTVVAKEIVNTKTNNEAAYKAEIQKAANAAASVDAAKRSSTNQPPSPVTTFVDKELGVALQLLPPPDAATALEVEKRRAAIMEGRLAEANKLYTQASTEADRLKLESENLKRQAAEAQVKLEAAQKSHEAALAQAQINNQAKLDAAQKKADEAVQKAYEERQNLLVRILIGIGAACILAGIALAIATSGASAVRSSIAAACGLVCFGMAKVLSHPWFNTVFVVSCILLVVGGVAYLWYERKHVRELRDTVEQKVESEAKLALTSQTLQHVVRAVEEVRGSSPEINKALEDKLDYHTSPDTTRPEYVRIKSAVVA